MLVLLALVLLTLLLFALFLALFTLLLHLFSALLALLLHFFSALDALTSINLREELLDLWADSTLPVDTIVMVTHIIEEAVEMADRIIVLSDRNSDEVFAPIPSLLLTSAVHHHLIREKSRTQVGLIVECGDAREVHHMALLVGYGAGAINPYLAFESIEDMVRGHVMLAATGVTDGAFLKGVTFSKGGATSHSVVMRSQSGTVRYLQTHHRFDYRPSY